MHFLLLFCKPEFTQGMVRVHEIVKTSGKSNYMGEKIPVFSGIDCEFLDEQLRDYNDKVIAQLMRYGAPISYAGENMEPPEIHQRNHSGANMFPRTIDEYLNKERKYKSVLGPFEKNHFSSSV